MRKRRKLSIYLAGGIESASKLGEGWRNELTPFLEQLGLEVLNPCEFEPQQLKGLQPNRLPDIYTDLHGRKRKPTFWHQLKNASETHLYNRFLKYMRRVIHFDMNIVENDTDYLICFWDEATGSGAGTHAELTAAFRHNLPVYCVCTTEMPAWAKACCTEIFLNFNDLREFLKEEFDYEEKKEDE